MGEKRKNFFVEGTQGSGKTTLLKNLCEILPGYKAYYEGDISPVELAWCSYMTEEQYRTALEKFPEFVEEIKKNTETEQINLTNETAGTNQTSPACGNQDEACGKELRYIVSYTKIRTEKREFYQYMEQYEIYSGRRSYPEFKEIIMKRYQKFHGEGNLFECSFFQNILEELMLYAELDGDEIIEFYRELCTHIDMENFRLFRLVSDDLESNILEIKKNRVNDKGEEVWFRLMMDYLMNCPYGKKHDYSGIDDLIAHLNRRVALEDAVIQEVLKDRCINLPSKQYRMAELEEVSKR